MTQTPVSNCWGVKVKTLYISSVLVACTSVLFFQYMDTCISSQGIMSREFFCDSMTCEIGCFMNKCINSYDLM